jgi:hypothetical protein
VWECAVPPADEQELMGLLPPAVVKGTYRMKLIIFKCIFYCIKNQANFHLFVCKNGRPAVVRPSFEWNPADSRVFDLTFSSMPASMALSTAAPCGEKAESKFSLQISVFSFIIQLNRFSILFPTPNSGGTDSHETDPTTAGNPS